MYAVSLACHMISVQLCLWRNAGIDKMQSQHLLTAAASKHIKITQQLYIWIITYHIIYIIYIMYIIQNDGPGGKASALACQTKLELALWFRFCPCTKVKDAQSERPTARLSGQQYVWAAKTVRLSGQQYVSLPPYNILYIILQYIT